MDRRVHGFWSPAGATRAPTHPPHGPTIGFRGSAVSNRPAPSLGPPSLLLRLKRSMLANGSVKNVNRSRPCIDGQAAAVGRIDDFAVDGDAFGHRRTGAAKGKNS